MTTVQTLQDILSDWLRIIYVVRTIQVYKLIQDLLYTYQYYGVKFITTSV